MFWSGYGSVIGNAPEYVSSSTVTLTGGLTSTYTETVGSTFSAYTATERGQDAVFSCDVLFSSSPADGQIFKMGGSGTGCWVGLRDGGTVFRVRAGDGISLTGSTNNAAVLDITDFPKDDQVHNIVWEFQPNVGRVNLWIDGIYKGEGFTTNGSSLESGQWSGTNLGNYLASSGDGPTGEPSAVWSAGTSGASVLTFYGNQLVGEAGVVEVAGSGIWDLPSAYLNPITPPPSEPQYRDLTGYPTSITLSGSDTNSRAFCFDYSRDGSIWIDENDNTLAKYVWVSGTTFTRDSTISLDTTTSGTNGGLILGLTDNGTDLFFATGGTISGANARIVSVNKSTRVTTLHATGIASGNSQGALWDGTNFYIGSYDTQYAYRVSTDRTSLTQLSYLFPSVLRAATYDYDNSLYYFSAATTVYRCTISGNTLSASSSYARTNGGSDEMGYINGRVYEQAGNTIVAP